MVEVDHAATNVPAPSTRPKTGIVTDKQLLEEPTFNALASGGVHTVVRPALCVRRD